MSEVGWRDGDVPYSERFADIYFSPEDGLAETNHVFLAGNRLPDAWAGQRRFCIAETGFGSGLNFCAALDLWRRTRERGARLDYVALEGYPLPGEAIGRALARWPALAPTVDALVARYPDPAPGAHRLHFDAFGASLTLFVGEAAEALAGIEAEVDAWFLDGFAPARNPEMWREEVLAEVARLAKPGATLATFTSAGEVRRRLAALGFAVEKRPGFGRKREMTVARRNGGGERQGTVPARYRAAPVDLPAARIAIVGAGIAGAALAAALVRRGGRPTVFDAAGRAGAGASGNPRALLMPRLDAGEPPAARFFAAAYRYALETYRALHAFEATGVLQLLPDARTAERMAKASRIAWSPARDAGLLNAEQAGALAGVALECPAAWYPDGGLVDPAAALPAMLSGAELREGRVVGLERLENGWRLVDETGQRLAEADLVFLAAGTGTKGISIADWVPLAPVRGQVSLVPAGPETVTLACALVWGGYIAPARDGFHSLGATHDTVNRLGAGWADAVTAEDHERNLAAAPAVLRRLLAGPRQSWGGRSALRAATPDRAPVFAPLLRREELAAAVASPRDGSRAPTASGVYMLSGLGSRGFVSAPLAAECLVSLTAGEPWPVEREAMLAGDPVRFAERAFRRGNLSAFLR